MTKWAYQIKIKGKIFDVVEHTDKECERPRTDGKHLAPRDHGFVCLYQNRVYQQWCGINFAVTKLIVNKNRKEIEKWLDKNSMVGLDYKI